MESFIGDATMRMIHQQIGVRQDCPSPRSCENVDDDPRMLRKSTILSILRKDSFAESEQENNHLMEDPNMIAENIFSALFGFEYDQANADTEISR